MTTSTQTLTTSSRRPRGRLVRLRTRRGSQPRRRANSAAFGPAFSDHGLGG